MISIQRNIAVIAAVTMLVVTFVFAGSASAQTGPIVSNLSIDATDSSATITFTTDKNATSSVEYGLTATYDRVETDTVLTTAHSVTLDSLLENTVYHFQLTVADSADNETVLPDSTFQTDDVTDPIISAVTLSDTTWFTVRVQWTTDEPTTSEIEVGDYHIIDDTLRTVHNVVLDELEHNMPNRFFRMMSGESYTMSITATDSSGNSSFSGGHTVETKSFIQGSLPAGWSTSDVGPVGLPGFATYDSVANGGTFRLVASGTQLYWDEDDFHFTYTPVAGDFELTAQVFEYSGILAKNTKASTHFRENLTKGSRMFNQSINYNDTDRLYYRIESDSNHIDIIRTELQPVRGDPVWFRLKRSGNVFTEYYSEDGTTWLIHGPAEGTNVKLPSAGLVGMSSLSRNNNNYSEITYKNVSVVQPADTLPPQIVDFNAFGNLDTLNIDFEASENITAVLEYGYFVPYSDSLISDTLIADNIFVLTGLDEGVEYNYRVVITDAGNNVVYDMNRTYTWGLLPVELVSLSAIQSGYDVLLQWTTASEINSTQFDVEISTGDEPFRNIGFVEAAGTSTKDQNYSYRITDLDAGFYRFRLRHIDTEGVTNFSDEVTIFVELAESFELSEAYPNPFNPQARFSLQLREQQDVSIEVYDMLGRRVQSLHDGELESHTKHEFTVDGSYLSSGMYLIRVTGQAFSITRKVTLLK